MKTSAAAFVLLLSAVQARAQAFPSRLPELPNLTFKSINDDIKKPEQIAPPLRSRAADLQVTPGPSSEEKTLMEEQALQAFVTAAETLDGKVRFKKEEDYKKAKDFLDSLRRRYDSEQFMNEEIAAHTRGYRQQDQDCQQLSQTLVNLNVLARQNPMEAIQFISISARCSELMAEVIRHLPPNLRPTAPSPDQAEAAPAVPPDRETLLRAVDDAFQQMGKESARQHVIALQNLLYAAETLLERIKD